MRWREFHREYAGLVYPLNAILWGLICLRFLMRQGDWMLIRFVAAKDMAVVGLALVLIALRWRQIQAAPASCAVSEALGEEGLSLAGYASPQTRSDFDLGLWGRLPRSVVMATHLSMLFDCALTILLR